MFEIYNQNLKEVLKLARNNNEGLEEYLLGLDFEIVKVVQTIMYIGRDRDYPENSTAEEIYHYNRVGLDNQRWSTKDIEVSQIVSKAPLYDYLRTGFRILEISI